MEENRILVVSDVLVGFRRLRHFRAAGYLVSLIAEVLSFGL